MDDADGTRRGLVDLARSALDRQLTHVEQNLSQYFSPNTHLPGEALALYVAGMALAGAARAADGASDSAARASTELDRQVHADGGHAELSAHYHRYTTDFYLLAALGGARRRRSQRASALTRRVRAAGGLPARARRRPAAACRSLGDDDGGQLFPMCGRAA